MDQHASTFEYPTSTAQENVTFQSVTTAPNPFDVWAGDYRPFTIHDQMEWLANNGGHFPLPGQDYLASLHPFPEPHLASPQQHGSMPHYQPQGQIMPTSNYPSELYVSSAPPDTVHQALDAFAPLEGSAVARPRSAETMLECGSSNESRPSSNSSSPSSRAAKFKVPTIRTQFGGTSHVTTMNDTPVSDGIQVAPDTDSMAAMSNEWMQIHGNVDQQNLHDQALSATSVKASPALLEAFQWQSPITRRTSMSSASGPVFSPYGTPTSSMWQQSAFNSPYSQQQNWTPVSNPNRFSNSPQSPYPPRGYGTWSRSQYLNSLRQGRNLRPSANTLPSRNKPRLVRNITDGYVVAPGMLPSQSRTRSGESRARARGESTSQPSSAVSQQLALPEFQLGTLFSSPNVSQAEFQGKAEARTPTRNILPSSVTNTPMAPPQSTPRTTITPRFNSFGLNSPYPNSQPFPHLPTNVPPTPTTPNPVPTPAHQPPLPVPSEPPLTDFLTTSTPATGTSSSPTHNHAPACGPIRQSPHFEGDIYTPRYKRRNNTGKWEGWCGYCQPGRWLDLKNSRFWEDKLRNHGICARTKTFFEGPVRVRWKSDRGTIWEGQAGDSGFDLAGVEGIEDDGVGRKREGLCGECNAWVGMDGMRSRGRGRCVAWWMHAYKCHEQSRSRTDGTGTGNGTGTFKQT